MLAEVDYSNTTLFRITFELLDHKKADCAFCESLLEFFVNWQKLKYILDKVFYN